MSTPEQFEENARNMRIRRAFFRSFIHGMFIAQAFAWKDSIVIITEEILPDQGIGNVARGIVAASLTTLLSMGVAAFAINCATCCERHLPQIEITLEPRRPKD